MSADIPDTWATCQMGDVADVVGGSTPPSKDPTNFAKEGGIPWITPADLSGYQGMYIGRGARSLSEKGFAVSSAMMLPSGSVLFSSRAPIGYVAIASNPLCTSQGFKSFVLSAGLDSRYVYFYLKYIKPLAEESATGTTFKELSGVAAGQLPLTVAPTNEQKRIAQKLEGTIASVEACRDRIHRIPALLKRLRQSIITTAASGDLTAEWRSNSRRDVTGSAGSEWSKARLSDLCENQRQITYGVIKLGPEVENGTPCLRTSDVRWLRVDTAGMRRIAPSLSLKHARTILRGGEVLVNVRGTLGGVAVTSREMTGWNVSREIAVVPVDSERILPTFLAFWIGSSASQRWLARVRKGVAYVGINIQDLRNLPVEVPPLEEQQEIIRRVSDLFSYVDQLEGRYTAILQQLERITPTLLTKAFRGELVPQNADDVPGSVLVEHIRNTRTATGVSDRKRQRSAVRRKQFHGQEGMMLNLEDIKREHLSDILNETGPLEPAALWALSKLSIDDFYDQLKDEETRGLLREHCENLLSTSRHLVAVK